MPYPDHLPATVAELIDELNERIQPPIVVGPGDRERMDQLIYDAGRRSIVDQLLYLSKQAAPAS